MRQVSGLPLVEGVVLQDVVVSELIDVEHIGGGMYRFTFATKFRDLNTLTEALEPRAALVLSASAVYRAALWALKAIGARCCGYFTMDRCSLH